MLSPEDRLRGSVFKSLETDKEFITRVRITFPWFSTYYAGQGMDDQVWESFKMQRRLIERSSEASPPARR